MVTVGGYGRWEQTVAASGASWRDQPAPSTPTRAGDPCACQGRPRGGVICRFPGSHARRAARAPGARRRSRASPAPCAAGGEDSRAYAPCQARRPRRLGGRVLMAPRGGAVCQWRPFAGAAAAAPRRRSARGAGGGSSAAARAATGDRVSARCQWTTAARLLRSGVTAAVAAGSRADVRIQSSEVRRCAVQGCRGTTATTAMPS